MTHTLVQKVYTGDTKRFRATVTDLDEVTLVDADGDVTFSIYDLDTNYLVHSGTATNLSTGIYFYDYTFPDYPSSFYVVFSGNWSGNPQLGRLKVHSRVRVS